MVLFSSLDRSRYIVLAVADRQWEQQPLTLRAPANEAAHGLLSKFTCPAIGQIGRGSYVVLHDTDNPDHATSTPTGSVSAIVSATIRNHPRSPGWWQFND